MKTFSKIMILAAVLALVTGSALAQEKAEKPQELDGKALFKANCKACHAVDAEAGEYTPMSYIMEQWEEFFDDLWTETHGEIACPKDETKKVTDSLDKDQLKLIRKFCIDHAADSEQPMTCG